MDGAPGHVWLGEEPISENLDMGHSMLWWSNFANSSQTLRSHNEPGC